MGKFDKEIKEAQKIADGWMKTSKDTEAFFIGVKKEHVQWEKEYIKLIEAKIKAKDPDAERMIEDCRDKLKFFRENCETEYDNHGKFVRGDPRKGAQGICDKLKIKQNTDVHKAVMDAMKKFLMDHTKQVQTAETTWTRDLEPRIGVLESKLDTLEKLTKGTEHQVEDYSRQLARDLKKYKSDMENAAVALKVDQVEKNIKDMTSNTEGFLGGSEKHRTDTYKLWMTRIAVIDKLKALAEKNHRRIVKSIPQDVRKKPLFGKGLAILNKARDDAVQSLNDAQKAFKYAVATYENLYPELV